MASTLLGCYKIDKELGRGAMAVVYRARDLRLNLLVAIEVLGGSLDRILQGGGSL